MYIRYIRYITGDLKFFSDDSDKEKFSFNKCVKMFPKSETFMLQKSMQNFLGGKSLSLA